MMLTDLEIYHVQRQQWIEMQTQLNIKLAIQKVLRRGLGPTETRLVTSASTSEGR